MSEYKRTVEFMENDCFRRFPPKLLLEHSLHAALLKMAEDGCSGDTIYTAAGAVWMLSHMQFFQHAPILPGDELTYRVSPRIEKRSCYLFSVGICRGTEQVADLFLSFIPVSKSTRHIIRLNLITPLWKTPAGEPVPSPMRRLRPRCEFVPCGSDAVRPSDCDSNGHMTSGAYLSLVCDNVGFWDSDTPRYMKMMQVDYSSEVYSGTVLHFVRGEADGIRYVRGIKPDGKIAFTAACDF